MKKSNGKRRGIIVAAVVLCLVLLVGGVVASGFVFRQVYAGDPITLEQAQDLALEKVGLTEATFTKGHYDRGDGVYELEFHYGRTEYELEVDAYTGWIRDADLDRSTIWDRLFD